jgi:hypothetical protein
VTPVTSAIAGQPLAVRTALAAAPAVVLAAWLATGIGSEVARTYADDLLTVLAALLASAMCLRAARRTRGWHRRFWGLFAGAMGLWAFAETVWAFHDLVLRHEPSVPSLADVGYLGGIPFVVAALLCHPAGRDSPIRATRRLLDSLLIAIALLMLSWTLVLGPLWHMTGLSSLGGVISLAYPATDVVMLFFIVRLARRVKGADHVAIWGLLAGLAAMALADSAFAYLAEVGSYGAANVIDAGWVLGYLAIAVGASCAPSAAELVVPEPAAEALSLGGLVAPFVPVLGALTLIAVEVQIGHTLDDVSLLSALALIALVLTRQAIVAYELVASRGTHVAASERLARAAVGEPLGR